MAASAGENAVAAKPAPQYEDGTILVAYEPGTSENRQEQIEGEVQAQDLRTIGVGTHVLRVAKGKVAEKVAKLLAKQAVRYAEPNFIVKSDLVPNDPSFPELWGLRNTGQPIRGTVGKPGADISATSAWDVSTGGTASVVGVVDSGIDYNHPDLAANVWSAPEPFTVTIGTKTINCAVGSHGFNAITNTCDPADDNNHGTHVSGTIGAVGNNGVGVAGVNWTASIMGLKFLDAEGSGSTANAINAIEFAIQAKQRFGALANVRVLNNSWGGGSFSQALLDQINKANTNGMLFVAAAGNDGDNNDKNKHYPASYNAPNVVSVLATNNKDARAEFSNFGRTSVHLGAPGDAILSTTRNNTYDYFYGTSMATPHVVGAAALVLSRCTLDTAQLKANLLNNVDALAALATRTVTGGRLNVNKAIRACSSSPPPPPTAPAAPTGLTATAGNAQVSLTWNASSGATSYDVKSSTTSGGPYTTLTNVTTTGYLHTGLTNGTPYHYVVSARNSVGESPNSTQVSATPQAPPPPQADFTLSVTPASKTVTRGASTTYAVTIARTGGFMGEVALTANQTPSATGITYNFSPNNTTANMSTLTVSTTTGTTARTYVVTITATSGPLVKTKTVNLVVSAGSGCQGQCNG